MKIALILLAALSLSAVAQTPKGKGKRPRAPLPETADDGSEVVLIEIENGGHTWPGMKPIVALLGESTMDISANDLMWEFFQKHPMKPREESKP